MKQIAKQNESVQGNRTDSSDVELMMPTQELRQEFRLTGRVRVDVEVEAVDGQQPARTVICGSSDLSANGLRLISPERLPTGAILPLFIHLGRAPLHLMGEVMWCVPEQSGGAPGYIAGFGLYESDQTSILEWKEVVIRLLEA